MNWETLTRPNLKLKRSAKFLLIFSICTLAVAGVVWACAFEDDSTTSIFSPEAFVSSQYTPFFYDSQNWYYGKNVEVTDNNSRFNEQVVKDWDGYLNHTFSVPVLRYLLLSAGKTGIDSVHDYINGKIAALKGDSLKINIAQLNRDKTGKLFNYLGLAKSCETFAIGQDRSWYDPPTPKPVAVSSLDTSLSDALNNSQDSFIKERLWFQLARYYFFFDDTAASKKNAVNPQARIITLFDQYKTAFPKNLIYYRTLGYVAGYYCRKGDYVMANYLYSRCYDFSYGLMIPSKFSFRAQQESDWEATLKLAKNKEETITLWHMLGMEYDPLRALRAIVALDPKSEKMDLLLSRLVNCRENSDERMYFISRENTGSSDFITTDNASHILAEIKLVDSIAKTNNTAKPYFWSIAAGYLHYLHHDYAEAANFYAAAKMHLPANDELITAQYRLLEILLNVERLKRIGIKTEAGLVEPLNWLKDFADGKKNICGFRPALCSNKMAALYLRQGDSLKAGCFNDTIINYHNKIWVQRYINLLTKADKSRFERTLVRYYPHTLDELYYHQALELVYKDDVAPAILSLNKMSKKAQAEQLAANPFSSRLNDCHDCDQAAPQRKKYTALSFLKTIQQLKTGLAAGKSRYHNALMLANAYYNISYYGNNRPFYNADQLAGPDVASQTMTKKYYLVARHYAENNEQRAFCTFMASKCEHNDYYGPEQDEYHPMPADKYFAELKKNYVHTQYYREVLKECGYFRDFVKAKK